MSDSDRIKEKLRKLLALAEQGVGGEKENAQSILDKLLKKHDMTLEDIGRESVDLIRVEFSFDGDIERSVLMQVIFKTLGVPKIGAHTGSKVVSIMATKPQSLEIDLAWSVYRAAFKKEQKRLAHAFIYRNNLFAPQVPGEGGKLSAEDSDAIIEMAILLKQTHVRKAIAGGAQE